MLSHFHNRSFVIAMVLQQRRAVSQEGNMTYRKAEEMICFSKHCARTLIEQEWTRGQHITQVYNWNSTVASFQSMHTGQSTSEWHICTLLCRWRLHQYLNSMTTKLMRFFMQFWSCLLENSREFVHSGRGFVRNMVKMEPLCQHHELPETVNGKMHQLLWS